jgi:spore maturation protein CgeB
VLAGTLYPWDWQWGANVHRFDHVAPAEHPAFYSSARATLNLTRQDMARVGYCPSPRLFEAAACRSAILSDEWPGLDTFLRPGEEIFVVETADDVLQVLGASDEFLARSAARARERVLAEHTGLHRAQQLLAYIEEAAQRPRLQQEAA